MHVFGRCVPRRPSIGRDRHTSNTRGRHSKYFIKKMATFCRKTHTILHNVFRRTCRLKLQKRCIGDIWVEGSCIDRNKLFYIYSRTFSPDQSLLHLSMSNCLPVLVFRCLPSACAVFNVN